MVSLFWGRSVLVESLLMCVGKVLVESRRHASYSDFFLTWGSCFWCGLTGFARDYDEFDLLRFNGFSRALGVGLKLLRWNSRDKARLSTGVWIFKSISVRFLDSIGEQLPSETSTYFNLYGLISSPRSVRAASFPFILKSRKEGLLYVGTAFKAAKRATNQSQQQGQISLVLLWSAAWVESWKVSQAPLTGSWVEIRLEIAWRLVLAEHGIIREFCQREAFVGRRRVQLWCRRDGI